MSYPDNQDPLNQGEAKPRDGAVAAGCWSGQAKRQEEADPVEKESHWNERAQEIVTLPDKYSDSKLQDSTSALRILNSDWSERVERFSGKAALGKRIVRRVGNWDSVPDWSAF